MSTIQVETIDPAVAAVDEKVSATNLDEDKPIAASSVSVVVDNEAPGWTVVEKADVDVVPPVAAEVMDMEVVVGGGGMTTTSGDVPFDEEKMDAIEKNAPSTMEKAAVDDSAGSIKRGAPDSAGATDENNAPLNKRPSPNKDEGVVEEEPVQHLDLADKVKSA